MELKGLDPTTLETQLRLELKGLDPTTYLAPETFADVLGTYQGHQIHRERAAGFQA